MLKKVHSKPLIIAAMVTTLLSLSFISNSYAGMRCNEYNNEMQICVYRCIILIDGDPRRGPDCERECRSSVLNLLDTRYPIPEDFVGPPNPKSSSWGHCGQN